MFIAEASNEVRPRWGRIFSDDYNLWTFDPFKVFNRGMHF